MSVVDALVAVGLVESRNAARRAIGDGGASVNGEKVTDAERVLAADDVLHERVVVLRRGRKALAAGRLAGCRLSAPLCASSGPHASTKPAV